MPNVSSFGAQTDNAVVRGTVTDQQMIIPEVPPQGLMSVGPRITPNFVKEPWDEHTSYNFFDAVKDGRGTTYVAIKPVVPAGTPQTDGDHWFEWSDFNTQFEELKEIVKTFDSRIKAVESSVDGLVSARTYDEIAAHGFIYKNE